jgi:hypothetical protein
MLNKVGVCLFTRSAKEAKQEGLSSLYLVVWRGVCVWGSQAGKLSLLDQVVWRGVGEEAKLVSLGL